MSTHKDAADAAIDAMIAEWTTGADLPAFVARATVRMIAAAAYMAGLSAGIDAAIERLNAALRVEL